MINGNFEREVRVILVPVPKYQGPRLRADLRKDVETAKSKQN